MPGRLVVELPAAVQALVAAGSGSVVLRVGGDPAEPGRAQLVVGACEVSLVVDLRTAGSAARLRLTQRLAVPDGGSVRFQPLLLA